MQSFRYVFTMIVIFSASFLAPHNMALKSTFSRRAGPPAGDEKKNVRMKIRDRYVPNIWIYCNIILFCIAPVSKRGVLSQWRISWSIFSQEDPPRKKTPAVEWQIGPYAFVWFIRIIPKKSNLP